MSWSQSKLASYNQCPHAFMYKRIIKLPEPTSYALVNGINIHNMAEAYLKGDMQHLPKELLKFEQEFLNLKNNGALAEEEIVLDSNWRLIPNGWDSEDAWLRLKIDARIDDYIVDFKTGRQYDDHVTQAKLYANALMAIDSKYDSIDVEFWYLNYGSVKSFTFYREYLESDIAEWQRQVDIMESDTKFLPREHTWCKYCYVKHLCPLMKGDK